MKFVAALPFLVGAASAFAPAGNNVRSTTTTQLNLWGDAPKKDGETGEMSQALPFAPRPKILDGTLAGDVGFE